MKLIHIWVTLYYSLRENFDLYLPVPVTMSDTAIENYIGCYLNSTMPANQSGSLDVTRFSWKVIDEVDK